MGLFVFSKPLCRLGGAQMALSSLISNKRKCNETLTDYDESQQSLAKMRLTPYRDHLPGVPKKNCGQRDPLLTHEFSSFEGAFSVHF